MKTIYFLIVMMLLVSCAPSTAEPTLAYTPSSLTTLTNTPKPTTTKSPTSIPAAPTATITPMTVATVSASPLMLTEFNVGTEMKRLNVIGTGTPHDITFSPDGKRLAVATGRGVYLYDGTTFEQNGFIDVNDSVSAIAFSPDGVTLAVAVDGKVSLWNVQSGQSLSNLEDGMVYIFKLVYGQGGFVAAIGGDCQGCGSPVEAMILWDAKTGRQIFSQHNIFYYTEAVAFTADGKQLVFGGNGINIIESKTGKLVTTYGGSPFDFVFKYDVSKLFYTSSSSSGGIINIANQTQDNFDLCSTYMTGADNIGACPSNNQMLIFDLSTAEKLGTIDIDVDQGTLGNMFAISPDGRFLVYHGKYGMYVIETKTGSKLKTLGFTDFDSALPFAVEIDGVKRYVVAAISSYGYVEVFDLQTGNLLRTLKLDCCEIDAFNVAPDQKSIVTLSGNVLNIWNISDQRVIYKEDLGDKYSGPIAFAPNGSKIYFFDNEPAIREFNLQTNAMKVLGGIYVRNTEYHFNTLGNLILLSYEKDDKGFSSPVFTDTTTKQETILPYHAIADADFIEAFALNFDDKFISFGNANGIFVWDAKTQKLIWHFDKHEQRTGDGWIGAIASLEFSPQSNLLASVGWDGTTRLWSISNGNQLRVLNACCDAHFTPDGRYLVTVGNGVIRVWGIPQ